MYSHEPEPDFRGEQAAGVDAASPSTEKQATWCGCCKLSPAFTDKLDLWQLPLGIHPKRLGKSYGPSCLLHVL